MITVGVIRVSAMERPDRSSDVIGVVASVLRPPETAVPPALRADSDELMVMAAAAAEK